MAGLVEQLKEFVWEKRLTDEFSVPTAPSLSLLERDKHKPSIDSVMLLSQYFEVSLDRLTRGPVLPEEYSSMSLTELLKETNMPSPTKTLLNLTLSNTFSRLVKNYPFVEIVVGQRKVSGKMISLEANYKRIECRIEGYAPVSVRSLGSFMVEESDHCVTFSREIESTLDFEIHKPTYFKCSMIFMKSLPNTGESLRSSNEF